MGFIIGVGVGLVIGVVASNEVKALTNRLWSSARKAKDSLDGKE